MRIRLFPLGMFIASFLIAGAAMAASPSAPFDGSPVAASPSMTRQAIGTDGLRTTIDAALVAGADYLRAMQADVTEDNAGNGTPPAEVPADPNDAGWDWVVTSPPAPFHHTTAASPTNIYGATVMGLYYAYLATGDYTYFTAMQDAADRIVAAGATLHPRTSSDMIFLMFFDDLPEVAGTTYVDMAKAKFDYRVFTEHTNGTIFAQWLRDQRGVTQGYTNGIIAWDLGSYAVAAGMLAERFPSDVNDYALTCDQIAEVLYQDSYMDNPGLFDIVDDAGWDPTYADVDFWYYTLGVSGLIDAFKASGTHTAEIPGLVTRLADSTYPSGAVSGSYGANTDDEDWQSTAYAAAALAHLDQPAYQTEIDGMGAWLASTQDVSGAWKYSSGNHYPEVAGENTMGLYFALPNVVTPTPEVGCLSIEEPCNVVSFVLARTDASPARGFSVTFELSDNLALCNDLLSDIVKGSFFDGYGYFPAEFQILDNGGGSYTVDCAVLGTPCGPTGGGTLFTANVKKVGPPDGVGTVTVTAFLLRDCGNQPIPVAPGAPAEITIDTTPPDAVADLLAEQLKDTNDTDGTTKVTLTFTVPLDAAVVEVYRAGFGHYPEYDDAGGSVPATPASYPPVDPPWALTAVTASGQTDEVSNRDFWYYVVYTKDACGNVSSVSNKTAGTLNYHLGDVTPPLGVGDNDVAALDISALGAHYGITIPLNDPNNYLDVGPTTNGSPDARPLTDNRINFEDLMIFSLNYGEVSKLTPLALALGSIGIGTVRLEAVPRSLRVRAGQTVEVPVALRGEAEGVHGIRTVLVYDAARFAYLSSEAGAVIGATEHFFDGTPSLGEVDLSVALLGRGTAVSGEGVLATVRLRALRDGVVTVTLKESSVRDVENRELLNRLPAPTDRLTASGSPATVSSGYRLIDAVPNPFGERTTIGFDLPSAATVRVVVYDVAGRVVRTLVDERRAAGTYSVEWDGTDDGGRALSAGVYFYSMQAGPSQSQRRVTLLR